MDSSCCPPEAEEDEEGEEEEEGGQGEYESFFITTLKVFNIQRLTKRKYPKLKFVLNATIQTEGTDKVSTVSYEVPLSTHLLNKND